MNKKPNPHAQALGRLGGKKGGPARAATMTPQERSEAARKAVLARWEAKKKSTMKPKTPSAMEKISKLKRKLKEDGE